MSEVRGKPPAAKPAYPAGQHRVPTQESPATDPRAPEPPVTVQPKKEEPVRAAAGTALIAAGLVVVCNKFGIADFTSGEAVTIVGAVLALANEAARMHVSAKPKP